MNHFYTTFLLFSFTVNYLNAQTTIKAKIVDSISLKPIPFASIAVTNNSGVISNDTGEFSLYINKIKKNDSLQIRCLGYKNKSFLITEFKDSIVFLSQKNIELNEILISNKKYTTEEIIAKTKENLSKNYGFDFIKHTLFYRKSNATKILKNEVEVKKTTIPEFNQAFINTTLTALPKYNQEHTELLANLYNKATIKSDKKLDIIKAAYLYDENTEIDFDAYEAKIKNILKSRIKRDSYFKIKSGWFGTKESIDSSFFDSKKPDTLLDAYKTKTQEQKLAFLNTNKTDISNILETNFLNKDSPLNILNKSKKYDFKLEEFTFLNDAFVYKINFYPKGKEPYKGTLYINTTDFAVLRIDYQNTKNLKNFNLLGISYTYTLNKGILIYNKNLNNKYSLTYAEVETANKFGFKRPLKIVEKNKHTTGRRKQNELSAHVHFILFNTTKKELVVFENETISENTFLNFEEKPKIKPVSLSKYDPEFWKGYSIIEPNKAIKEFKSME